jgi:PKD repeat protein
MFSIFTSFRSKLAAGLLSLVFACFGVLPAALADTLPNAGGLAPTASLSASSTVVVSGRSISFDAAASHAADGSRTGLQYRWDFESKYTWTAWSTSTRATHIYANAGDTAVRLQVRDRAGYSDETSLAISVRERGGAPITTIAATPTSGDTNTVFQFTANPISQIGTTTRALEVRWDYEGDGVWDTPWSTTHTAYHTYATTGYHEVTVQTRDTDGSTSIEQGYYMGDREDPVNRIKEIGRVLVGEGSGLRASFQLWPTSGVSGTVVHFDATATQGATAYRWDFDADGNYDTAWQSNPKAEYLYEHAGTYQATLAVQSGGQTDFTKRQVTIIADELAPEASFTLRNTTNTVSTEVGTVGDQFAFSAAASRDPTGKALRYRWDFEGDGTYDTGYSSSAVATHAYTAAGHYRPLLQVLSLGGKRAEAEAELAIVANTPPVAVITLTPATLMQSERAVLSAAASYDGQTPTSALQVRWDYDGDGTYDTTWQSGKSVSRVFGTAGEYAVTLQVRDRAGSIGTAQATLTVIDPAMPQVYFVTTPTTGTFQTRFQFAATPTLALSQTGRLQYRWDFDSAGRADLVFDTAWSSSSSATHSYQTVGEHLVHLAVRNAAGETADFYETITIHSASPALAYLRQQGIIRQEGTPDGLLTRAELANLLAKAAKLSTPSTRTQYFTDVESGSWYAPAVLATVRQGYLSVDQSFAFRPAAPVTRAELFQASLAALWPRVVTASSSSPSFADVSPSASYYRYVQAAAREGLVTGTSFGSERQVTRAEAAELLTELLQRYATPTLRGQFYATGLYFADFLSAFSAD